MGRKVIPDKEKIVPVKIWVKSKYRKKATKEALIIEAKYSKDVPRET